MIPPLHRVNLAIAPPAASARRLLPHHGFTAVYEHRGRLLAVVESWDEAVEYCHRVHRGAAGRVLRAASYTCGRASAGAAEIHQLAQVTRWRVELWQYPRRETWTQRLKTKRKRKPNPWTKPERGDDGQPQ